MFKAQSAIADYISARQTFIKRYTAETTNKAQNKTKRREEDSEKAENCRKDLWTEIQLKRAIKTDIDTRTE